MTVKVLDETIYCTKAVKNADAHKVILYNEDKVTDIFNGVERFEDFSIEDGEWSYPDPTTEEQLRADVDYLSMENESLTAEAEQSRADIDYAMMLLGEEVE